MSKIREYFTFTRSERNGILLLLSVILILLVLLQTIPLFFDKTQIDYSSYEGEVDKFISSVAVENEKETFPEFNKAEENYNVAEYFIFDPNTVTENEMSKLGIPKRLIKTWIKYRSKGGQFRKNEDLKTLWGMQDSLFEKLAPYISIKESEVAQNNWKDKSAEWKNKENEKKNIIIELNSVDSTGLCSLPGIGPGFSKRILKYRDLLGGYMYKEQILEVFGFTKEMFDKIEKMLTVDVSKVRKININKTDFKQLIRHPYSTKESVNKILEYRRIQGKISNIKDLVRDKMLTQEQCAKIEPYIEY